VLAAVHCLDQGVDIPKIDAAIIVASSTNPREYIQRRGRILRASPNKTSAELNDIVAVTPEGRVALRSDISRAREIGEFAENRERVLLDISYLEGTIDADETDSVEGDDSGD
jgi:superfamily II DNA or RNA helicase